MGISNEADDNMDDLRVTLNEEGEVFIYRYAEDEDGNPSLDNITSDEEYEAVSDRFDELLDEELYEDMED